MLTIVCRSTMSYLFISTCSLCHEYENHYRWQTKIVLALKESHLTSNMAKKFNDIQPSLLLFLHRLRSITVEDKVHMYLYRIRLTSL